MILLVLFFFFDGGVSNCTRPSIVSSMLLALTVFHKGVTIEREDVTNFVRRHIYSLAKRVAVCLHAGRTTVQYRAHWSVTLKSRIISSSYALKSQNSAELLRSLGAPHPFNKDNKKGQKRTFSNVLWSTSKGLVTWSLFVQVELRYNPPTK